MDPSQQLEQQLSQAQVASQQSGSNFWSTSPVNSDEDKWEGLYQRPGVDLERVRRDLNSMDVSMASANSSVVPMEISNNSQQAPAVSTGLQDQFGRKSGLEEVPAGPRAESCSVDPSGGARSTASSSPVKGESVPSKSTDKPLLGSCLLYTSKSTRDS